MESSCTIIIIVSGLYDATGNFDAKMANLMGRRTYVFVFNMLTSWISIILSFFDVIGCFANVIGAHYNVCFTNCLLFWQLLPFWMETQIRISKITAEKRAPKIIWLECSNRIQMNLTGWLIQCHYDVHSLCHTVLHAWCKAQKHSVLHYAPVPQAPGYCVGSTDKFH